MLIVQFIGPCTCLFSICRVLPFSLVTSLPLFIPAIFTLSREPSTESRSLCLCCQRVILIQNLNSACPQWLAVSLSQSFQTSRSQVHNWFKSVYTLLASPSSSSRHERRQTRIKHSLHIISGFLILLNLFINFSLPLLSSHVEVNF